MKINRIDYGIVQWAADVGGLYNLLSKLFMFMLSFLVAGGAHMFVGLQLMTRSADYYKNRVLRKSTKVSHDAEKVQEHCCMIVRMKLATNKLCRPCMRTDSKIQKILNS